MGKGSGVGVGGAGVGSGVGVLVGGSGGLVDVGRSVACGVEVARGGLNDSVGVSIGD